MNEKPGAAKDAADKLIMKIRRTGRKVYSAEGKIRIVAAYLRREKKYLGAVPSIARQMIAKQSADN